MCCSAAPLRCFVHVMAAVICGTFHRRLIQGQLLHLATSLFNALLLLSCTIRLHVRASSHLVWTICGHASTALPCLLCWGQARRTVAVVGGRQTAQQETGSGTSPKAEMHRSMKTVLVQCDPDALLVHACQPASQQMSMR